MAATDTSTALDVRTNAVVATLRHPDFMQQVKETLPENVSLEKFVRVATTVIRSNPDLVNTDQTALFGAIVKCAQDGLYPDGREAALVPYKGKVSYIPMIGGFRKIAADHGWALRTKVVYANDAFDYTEEPPEIHHKPVRPGETRGELVAAYAVATHRDGRRMQTVLHPDDVAKRRGKAQTQAVWNEWPAAMWEKSAGRDLFGQLPISDRDLVERLLAEDFIDEGSSAAEALYGPNGAPVPAVGPAAVADVREAGQQAATAPETVAAPGSDIEDGVFEPIEDEAPAVTTEELAAAGSIKVTSGAWKDRTLDEIAEAGDEGATWLLVQLKKATPGSAKWQPLATVIQARLPETWRAYETWRTEQS